MQTRYFCGNLPKNPPSRQWAIIPQLADQNDLGQIAGAPKQEAKIENRAPSDQHPLTTLIPALSRLARILAPTPDMAEDMAQDALLRVWARLDKGAKIEDLRPYLMTTLRNASTKPTPQGQELTEQNTPSHPAEIWDRFACLDVTRAISQLPDEQAELLRPLVLHGTSYAGLAKAFDLPIGTVMSRISRARAQLRTQLDLPKSRAVETLLEELAM